MRIPVGSKPAAWWFSNRGAALRAVVCDGMKVSLIIVSVHRYNFHLVMTHPSFEVQVDPSSCESMDTSSHHSGLSLAIWAKKSQCSLG